METVGGKLTREAADTYGYYFPFWNSVFQEK